MSEVKTTKLRRNQVVYYDHKDGAPNIYERVIKRISDTHVMTMSSKFGEINIYDDTELSLVFGYKGYYNWSNIERGHGASFVEFPSIRRLKQWASRWQTGVWKRGDKPHTIKRIGKHNEQK